MSRAGDIRPSRIPLSKSNVNNTSDKPPVADVSSIKRPASGPSAHASSVPPKQARFNASSSSSSSFQRGNSSTLSRPLSSSSMTGRATLASSSLSARTSTRTVSHSIRDRSASPTPHLGPRAASDKIKQLEEQLQMKTELLELRSDQKDRALLDVEKLNDKVALLKGEVEKIAMENADLRSSEQSCMEKIKRLEEEVLSLNDIRKELHNHVVDLRGQIRVAVRARPLLVKEKGETLDHITFPSSQQVVLDLGGGKNASFELNNVFGYNYSQERVFEALQELIASALDGFNVSLIAYGQTGSGKTHTMRGGNGDSSGIIPRAISFLFKKRLKMIDLHWKISFNASFYEVYNEECFDLLSTPPRVKCDVKIGSGQTIINGLSEHELLDEENIIPLLSRYDRHRSTAATKCNEESSRSHAVFSLQIRGQNECTGAIVTSTLNIVDLAGSERVKESEAKGIRFTEMTYINKALSSLKDVIQALVNKQQHIPYRNSLLTKLLQDSLGGGKSKSLILVTLNPCLSNLPETKRSLEFAKELSKTSIGVARKREQ